MSEMVFSYSIFNLVILCFLKLMQSWGSHKFTFLFWYLQIRSKSASEFALFLSLFRKLASIRFRKLFTPFSFIQIRFRIELIRLKMKPNLDKIPKALFPSEVMIEFEHSFSKRFFLQMQNSFKVFNAASFGTKYSRMDQVKFVEDNL